MQRALRDGEREEGLIPVLVDFYRVVSLADVTVRLERAYARHLKGAIRARVDQFLQRTGIGLSLGVTGISARIQLDPKADPLPALHALLDLPLRLEQSGGYRALIAFDEFQDVDKVPNLDGLLRSHIQFHGEVASYVFAGSEPGLMEQLFEDRDRPLYGSAVPMRLGRLAAEDVGAYVAERFEETNRGVGEALGPLLQAAAGIRSARCCLRTGSGPSFRQGGTRRSRTGRRARGGTRRARGRVRRRMAAPRHVLAEDASLARRGRGSPYRGDVLRRLALTKDMVRKALPRLAASALIERHGDQHADRRSALRGVDRARGDPPD